jgi:hypothetical protein
MQSGQTIEPRLVWFCEIHAGSAIGEHRPLAKMVDQHDDRPGGPPTSDGDANTFLRECRDHRITNRVIADLADESGGPTGTDNGDRHVGRTASAPTFDRRSGVRGEVNFCTQTDGDVFDEVTNTSDHDSRP